jgi:hypothetical protein
VIKSLVDVSKVWEELFPSEQARIIQLLIKQVIITPEGIDLRIYNDGFNLLSEELANESKEAA